MSSKEVLKKINVERLAGEPVEVRRVLALQAYRDTMPKPVTVSDDIVLTAALAGFLSGFDTATETMAYMHMAQDARAAEQKEPK